MNPLQEIISEQLVHALGWTLIHSLWQGALIGLLIAVAMIFLQKHTARLRYFIYSMSLILFAGLAVVTFFSSYFAYVPDRQEETTTAGINHLVTFQGEGHLVNSVDNEGFLTQAYLEAFSSYCRENMPLIVMIWLMGMLISMLRFLGGYALVRRYRTHRVKETSDDWQRRFRMLVRQVRVNKSVRLLESALVKVPMAIGYLKPVVLVPLGAFSAVPPEQMEAILVHELAHIYRRDYLVNMLQSLLEAIFFYHPVVWWLSGNIRNERENICDDIAITITGNTMEFAKALTNIQEMNLSAPGLAAGLSGKNKNRLLYRIRRLAHKPKIHPGFTEGFIAAGILILSLAGLSAAAMITYPVNEPLPAQITFAPAGSILPGYSNLTEVVAVPDTTIKENQKAEQVAAEQEEVAAQEQELSEEELQQVAEAEAAVEAQREMIEAQVEAMQTEIKKAMHAYQEAMEDIDIDHEQYEQQMKVFEKALKESQARFSRDLEQNWDHVYVPYQQFYTDSLLWNFEMPDSLIWFGDSLEGLYFGDFEYELPDLEDLQLEFETQHDLMELQQKLQELEHLYVPAPDYNRAFHYDNDKYFPVEMAMTSRAKNLVTSELYEDDLIEHGREYVVVIDDKQMLVNGEKQSRSAYKKYRRLVDSLEEPWKFGDNDEFKIFIER